MQWPRPAAKPLSGILNLKVNALIHSISLGRCKLKNLPGAAGLVTKQESRSSSHAKTIAGRVSFVAERWALGPPLTNLSRPARWPA